MNLLNDVRENEEKKWVPVSEKPIIEPPDIEEEDFEEPVIPLKEELMPPPIPEEPALDWSYTKKRSSTRPILISFIAIIALAALVFIGYNYFASGKLPFAGQQKPVQEETDQQMQPDSAGGDQQQPVETVGTPAATASESPIQKIANRSNIIVGSLPQSVNLLTLIMDETSLSAEISASTLQRIQSYFESLQQQIPGELTLSSSSGADGQKALISGFLSGIRGQSPLLSPEFERSEFQKNINSLAYNAEVRVTDFSVGDAFTLNSLRKTPVFIKVVGSVSACQAFFSEFVGKYPALQISKMLLMSSQPGQANLVLRILVSQSS